MIEELCLHRYSYEIISIGNQFEIKVLPASMTQFIEYVAFFDIDEMFWDQSHIHITRFEQANICDSTHSKIQVYIKHEVTLVTRFVK